MSRRSQGRTWFEDGLILIGHKNLRFVGALILMVIGYVYEPLTLIRQNISLVERCMDRVLSPLAGES